jgi:hypothetical protein
MHLKTTPQMCPQLVDLEYANGSRRLQTKWAMRRTISLTCLTTTIKRRIAFQRYQVSL